MKPLSILPAVIWLAASGPALGQGAPPAQPSPTDMSAIPSGTTSSRAASTNPVLMLHGMPCSVSLNATGGITTSSSCGSDPLEVPARTLAAPEPVTGSAQTSSGAATGGTSSRSSAGGTTTQGSGAAGTATTSSSAAPGGGAPSISTLCASAIPTTGGGSGIGSL